MASGHIVSNERSIGSVGGFNDGTEKTHLENEANAAFIVKAVNNHYQLLEALKELYRNSEAGSKFLNKAEAAIKEAE